MKTLDELFEEVKDMESKEEFLGETFPALLLDEIQNDSELPDMEKIYNLYEDGNTELIDSIFIALCGWTFKTLIGKALIKHFFNIITMTEARKLIVSNESVYAIDEEGGTEFLIEKVNGRNKSAAIYNRVHELHEKGFIFGTEKNIEDE